MGELDWSPDWHQWTGILAYAMRSCYESYEYENKNLGDVDALVTSLHIEPVRLVHFGKPDIIFTCCQALVC